MRGVWEGVFSTRGGSQLREYLLHQHSADVLMPQNSAGLVRYDGAVQVGMTCAMVKGQSPTLWVLAWFMLSLSVAWFMLSPQGVIMVQGSCQIYFS